MQYILVYYDWKYSNMILFYILLDFKIYDFHLHYLYCTFCVVYSNLNMYTTGMYNNV